MLMKNLKTLFLKTESNQRFSNKLKNRENAYGTMIGKGLTDQTMNSLAERFSSPKTEKEYRDRVIFLLASSTGLRAKELVNLRFSSIIESPEGEKIVRYVKKGGSVGYAVILEEILEEVRKYHESCGICSDYFILTLLMKNRKERIPLSTRGLQMIIGNWDVKTAAGKKIHPHSIRHTVGQRIFDQFGSIAAQKILGHTSPNTTSNFYTRPYFNPGNSLLWYQPKQRV